MSNLFHSTSWGTILVLSFVSNWLGILLSVNDPVQQLVSKRGVGLYLKVGVLSQGYGIIMSPNYFVHYVHAPDL